MHFCFLGRENRQARLDWTHEDHVFCAYVYLCICVFVLWHLICAPLVGHNQTHAGHRSTDRAAPVSSGEAEDLLSLSQSLNSHLDFFCKKEGQEQWICSCYLRLGNNSGVLSKDWMEKLAWEICFANCGGCWGGGGRLEGRDAAGKQKRKDRGRRGRNLGREELGDGGRGAWQRRSVWGGITGIRKLQFGTL